MNGIRASIHFDNAWLLAYIGGEFGGGLWLTNEDGTETKRILDEDVRAMIPTDYGIVVLSGLAHMSMDFGYAFIFSKPDGMNISLQHAVHLDGEPSGGVQEPSGSVLFATTYNLCRITKTGELKRLMWLPTWMRLQYPNSIALTSDGSIYIGMRMFVLRIHENDRGLTEEWLLPHRVF